MVEIAERGEAFMRLLADRLQTGICVDERASLIQRNMRLPSLNHSPGECAAAVERFVIADEAGFEMFFETFKGNERIDALEYAKPPCVPCWIELPHLQLAFYIDVVGQHGLCVSLLTVTSKGAGVMSWSPIADLQNAEGGSIYATKLGAKSGNSDEHSASLLKGLIACLIITSNRVATTRRMSPSTDTAADRAMLRRRAQQGRPVFSHNIVTVTRPETSEFRGRIIESVSRGPGVRAHIRAGHWRLISTHVENGELCPYWTWVDGHEVGDEQLGRVVKTRIVEFSPAGIRKGFVVPSFAGTAGDRVQAVRAH